MTTLLVPVNPRRGADNENSDKMYRRRIHSGNVKCKYQRYII